MLHIDTATKEGLIRELSVESVLYFTNLELAEGEWPSNDSPKDGKFVRIGEVIVVGPDIDYGPLGRTSDRRLSLNHRNMCYYVLQGMGEELVARIKATTPENGSFLGGIEGVLDAGYTKILASDEGVPSQLILKEKSYDFGRGDDAARERTREIASTILAPNIAVTVE